MSEEHFHKTGLFLELINHDELFERYKRDAIIVNDFDLKNDEHLAELEGHLYSFYEGDCFDTMPSCDCGHLKGEYNAELLCPECDTLVRTETEQPIEPKLWMRIPEGVEGFINPQFLIILKQLFDSRSVSFIEYLINDYYRLPNTLNGTDRRVIEQIEALGWRNSVNEFIQRFDEIIPVLLHEKYRNKPAEYRQIVTFIQENRDRIFSRYLPVPNRALLIIEKTRMVSDGTQPIQYVDEYLWSAPDAVMTLCSLNTYVNPKVRVKDHKVAKALIQLSNFYASQLEQRIGKKQGMVRKQIFGSRFDFSARAVIASLSRTHSYEELEIPWGVGLHIFKLHLTNKLMRRGFTPDEAEGLIYRHTREHPPHQMDLQLQREKAFLGQLLDEIIEESPHEISYEAAEIDTGGNLYWRTIRKKGFPALLNRNPTLLRGSVQLFYITNVKKDPSICAIKMSTLTLRSPNADKNPQRLRMYPKCHGQGRYCR